MWAGVTRGGRRGPIVEAYIQRARTSRYITRKERAEVEVEPR